MSGRGRGCGAPLATPPPAGREVLGLGLVHLGVALVGLAVVLAPARAWNLPAVDAERYAFAFVAPLALVLAGLAEDPVSRARRALAVGAVAYLLCVPTARIAHGLLEGGGPDRGDYVLRNGGGYHGWRTPREREAVPVLVQREVRRVTGGAPATILVADYALHPLHFENAHTPWPTVDVLKFGMPRVRAGARYFFVVWSDGLFAPGYWPPLEEQANARLRAAMHDGAFERVERVRAFTQPDGSPLLEVWTAVAAHDG